jgi:hypothetical protein
MTHPDKLSDKVSLRELSLEALRVDALPRFVEAGADGVTIRGPERLFQKGTLAFRWADAGKTGLILAGKSAPYKVTGVEVEGNTLFVETERVGNRPRFSWDGGKSPQALCFHNESDARIAYHQLRAACPKAPFAG